MHLRDGMSRQMNMHRRENTRREAEIHLAHEQIDFLLDRFKLKYIKFQALRRIHSARPATTPPPSQTDTIADNLPLPQLFRNIELL